MLPLHHFIRFYADHTPQSPAITSPGRKTLNYCALLTQMEKTCALLNANGIGRNDPVAIVLPEGPEMAVTLLSAACTAVAAPLNPAYSLHEFLSSFGDLQVKSLITLSGFCELAKQAAFQMEIPILWMNSDPNLVSGQFELFSYENRQKKDAGLGGPDDLALLSFTSGTTSRPKIVPLTHRNISTSIQNIAKSLQLSEIDRCLNVMPLFHIHGSIICTFTSLATGGCVIATPGFIAPKFLDWLVEMQPTWYSAAPSIHHSVLEQMRRRGEWSGSHNLRFIRSSAAAMPVPLLEKVEETFGVPFIEGYGLSETAHLLTSNFLPPFYRKPGSVGKAAGPEVAIMQENGDALVQPNLLGEIVARGPNVMSGYLNNPEANQQAFCAGWFRTGDQGYVDEDGYFYITGRIKEIINRGGEKISPREVDEALLKHPNIRHAVTFGVPDDYLGEEIGVAVVLDSPEMDEKQIRQYLAAQLAYFKVPRWIMTVDEIPTGPTGKIQRLGLAEKFGLTEPVQIEIAAYTKPENETEKKIARLWKIVLAQENVGTNQSFISLGGDSILAGSLAIALQEQFGVKISLIDLFDAPTISDQAMLIERKTA